MPRALHTSSLLAATAALLLLGASRALPEEPLTFAEATAIALDANPELAAARLARGVAQAEIDVAVARPDPEVGLEFERETPHQSLSLGLPLETAGKRRKRVGVAMAEGRAGEAEIARRELDVRNRVRRAYFALAAAERRAAETGEILTLSRRIRDAAGARFEAGAVARLEVVRADLAVATAETESDAAAASLTKARIDLATLLGRPADAPLAIAAELAAGAVPDPAQVASRAESSSGELALLDRRIEAAAARVEVARAGRYPDPVLQPVLTHGAAPEFDYGWRAGITVTVPLAARRRAEIAVAERTLAQLRAERAGALARIRGEVAAALAAAQALRRQVDAYEKRALPQATEVAEMAVDSYSSGQTDLVAMLQALQSSHDTRLRAVDRAFDLQIALADLEAAMGSPLP
jgi:cobalt-zinc-cadmium efflux system outer membrane protein